MFEFVTHQSYTTTLNFFENSNEKKIENIKRYKDNSINRTYMHSNIKIILQEF